MLDIWGSEVAATDAHSVDAWNDAWDQALHFVDDPFATLAEPNATDEAFAMGSVFCGIYRLLAGARPDSVEVQADINRATARAETESERAHVGALAMFAEGNFTRAALAWDAIASTRRDFAAVRFAHDVYLHVGNTDDRLASSERAAAVFDSGPGWNLVASQLAFSLEEAGQFDRAEAVGWRALEADQRDLWACHALAHVYEHVPSLVDGQDAGLHLLRSRQATWSAQDGLAVHLWWHLALRLIDAGEFDEVLSLHDELVADATTPFRLCDLASMLWRLELRGVDVGSRWAHLAEAYAVRPERHTAGFLDLHMALAFTRSPDHPAAQPFFEGIWSAGDQETSENEEIFRTVVRPLADAIRSSEANPAASGQALASLDPVLHRIGGSNAQRDLVTLTRQALEAQQ